MSCKEDKLEFYEIYQNKKYVYYSFLYPPEPEKTKTKQKQKQFLPLPQKHLIVNIHLKVSLVISTTWAFQIYLLFQRLKY